MCTGSIITYTYALQVLILVYIYSENVHIGSLSNNQTPTIRQVTGACEEFLKFVQVSELWVYLTH